MKAWWTWALTFINNSRHHLGASWRHLILFSWFGWSQNKKKNEEFENHFVEENSHKLDEKIVSILYIFFVYKSLQLDKYIYIFLNHFRLFGDDESRASTYDAWVKDFSCALSGIGKSLVYIQLEGKAKRERGYHSGANFSLHPTEI